MLYVQIYTNIIYLRRRRGYSLTGKTLILRINILGSSPSISIKAREAQPGRAELWRCFGYKFKSYLEHSKGSDGIGRHE